MVVLNFDNGIVWIAVGGGSSHITVRDWEEFRSTFVRGDEMMTRKDNF